MRQETIRSINHPSRHLSKRPSLWLLAAAICLCAAAAVAGTLGSAATGDGALESQITRIGNGQTKVFVAGIAGVPVSGATVVVKANGQLGVVASSARYKTDIKSLGEVSDKLARLRPVSYRYKTEPEATHYGLIAEEVDQTMPELVVRDEQNRPDSVQYMELIPLLLQEWKAQRALIERQQTELADLRRTLATRLATLDKGSGENGTR